MMIQANYGVLAYGGIAALSAQRQTGRITQAITSAAAETAEQVTISDAGKALAAHEDAPVRRRTPAQEEFLRRHANMSAVDLEYAVKAHAEWQSRIVYRRPADKDDWPPKLHSSGRVVDDAYVERFERTAPLIDAQRRALYESEKQKGTDDFEILEKMIDFDNAQSYEWREATEWGYREDEAPEQGASGGKEEFNGTALLMAAQKRAIYENEKIKATEDVERLCKWMESEDEQQEES
ncbi:MAG: hypothetical protein IKU14_04610 [Rhodocyclaceae bacterium]|nr:hypothetical protein [Rhodocyclaceae bacterium]